MCFKLFILKEFYFLILELNGEHIININASELLSTKIKKSIVNESSKKKKCFAIIFFEKNMDNLHFILNNILINFLKS